MPHVSSAIRLDRLLIRLAFAPALIVLGIVLAACAQIAADPVGRLPVTITGVVRGPNGPVPGALVQLQGTQTKTTSGPDGAFKLHGEGLGGNKAVTITAWAEEHYVGMTGVDPADEPGPIQVELKPLFDRDNHAYTWFEFNGKTGSASCGECHRETAEFQADAHSRAARNPRFLNIYRGTDIQGRKGQPTRLTAEGKALPPDPALPDYGPGFKLDNGDRSGNCAACHAPMASREDNKNGCAWSGCHSSTTAERAEAAKATSYSLRGPSPVGMAGAAEEGVGCEFCHVVKAVRLDPNSQLPFSDAPGIMSLELRRPPEGHKVFFGTISDPNREEVTYSPQMATSQACAACHYGVMGGVVANMRMTGGVTVYNSYGEWLDSPYSDPKSGKTCQDCHMPVKNAPSVPVDKGGVDRPGYRYHDHKMAGAGSRALMWNALTVDAVASREGDVIRVNVTVSNTNTGHAVPTDAPIRSVMLLVEAFDAAGAALPMRDGPALPEWTGDFAGRPGRAYAKILKDLWTGESPTAAYWRQIELVEDTRIHPFKSDASQYTFAAPAGAASVKIRLIYRPAFYKIARQKGWPNEDVLMRETVLAVGNQ